MYPLIVCTTCGCPLGDIYDIYIKELGKDIDIKLNDIKCSPETAIMNVDLKISAGDILDKLGIDSYCCRMHMITNVTFDNFCE